MALLKNVKPFILLDQLKSKRKKKLNYTLGDDSSLKGDEVIILNNKYAHTHTHTRTHTHREKLLYTCDKC